MESLRNMVALSALIAGIQAPERAGNPAQSSSPG